MKKWALIGATLLFASNAQAQQPWEAQAEVIGNEGKPVGMAQLRQTPHGVLMHLKVEGLTPGAHGLHFHSVGDCSDHDHFKAAAGHVTSSEALLHGLGNPQGAHEGDLPNIYAGADGKAEAEFFAAKVALEEGKLPALLDKDGSAVMIHAQPDDHISQPIGGAGDRMACGVIEVVK